MVPRSAPRTKRCIPERRDRGSERWGDRQLSARAGIKNAMPEGYAERLAELECVCLGDVAGVPVDNGARDNRWALALVTEPASRLHELESLDSRDFRETVVERETAGRPRGGASLHRCVSSKQTIDRLFRYAFVIGDQDDTR